MLILEPLNGRRVSLRSITAQRLCLDDATGVCAQPHPDISPEEGYPEDREPARHRLILARLEWDPVMN